MIQELLDRLVLRILLFGDDLVQVLVHHVEITNSLFFGIVTDPVVGAEALSGNAHFAKHHFLLGNSARLVRNNIVNVS